MKRIRSVLLCLLIGSFLLSLSPPPAESQTPARWIRDQYIVVFRDDVTDPTDTADLLGHAFGFHLDHVFERALKGFSARIPARLLNAVLQDARVQYVVPDQEVVTFAQTVPTGVQRIGADHNAVAAIDGVNTPIDVGIAIIDTGINQTHPDLNVKGGVCVIVTYLFGIPISSCSSPEDDNGHGTHVAGIAAALDNDIGVVGVAPGARLYAVKVLGKTGSGSLSNVIKGIDWVTQNAGSLNIKVANMSMGASGSDDGNCGRSNNDPLHTAICNSVAAGVTYVVAAGNSGVDAKNTIPAAYPEVITVSALADTDGQPGGLGPVSTYGADDTFATFSNYGPGVDLIAPGVSILSTYPNGGYATLSGTSMAAPHVAGAAALYIAQNPGASPQQVRQALINQGDPGPWPGDSDAIAEPLVYVGAFHDVAVTTISAPAWVLTDSVVPIEVTVTVKNTGTFQETPTLTLTDQTTGTIWGPIDIGPLPLEPGATITTSFQWTATPAGLHTLLGQVSLVATAGVEDVNAANDAKNVTIEVKDPVHDVAVTGLTAPATAIREQAVTITATVANLGTFDEGPFDVTLTDNGTPVESATAVSLPAGGTTNLTFSWTPPTPGSHTLAVTAVLAGEEVVNQANNAKQVPIEVADPFTDASVTALTAPTSAITGQAVTVSATVANLGNVAASFTVSLTDNAAPVGLPIAVSSLPAGGATNLTFTWTPLSASTHTLEARAVVAGDTTPGNDFKMATVDVSDVKVLAVTVTTNKAAYTAGQTVTVTTLVKDNGGVPVSGASIQIVIKGANGRTTTKIGTTSSSGTFVLNWGTSSSTRLIYGRGTYTVTATATKSGFQSGGGVTSFTFQ
jgi:subtilisin family serine protease